MVSSFNDNCLSVLAMVIAEIVSVGGSTITKSAMTNGMNRYVFAVYHDALATLVLLPCILFHRRRHPLTFSLLCKFFLLGLIGSIMVILGMIGLDYSSPTLLSALMNVVPAFTFILACIFRMEKFYIKSKSSQAKALGTIISITGAIIATQYKGKPFIVSQFPSSTHQVGLTSPQSNWVIGGSFLAGAFIFLSVQIIMQATILKEYPAELGVAFFYCFFVTIQTSLFTLIAERDLSVWRLKSGAELIDVLYAAVAAVLVNIVNLWCLSRKGPIFVSSFKPVEIVIAILMSGIILGDKLYTGSAIGSVVIAIGYYGVLWGKSKEENVRKDTAFGILDPSLNTQLLGNSNEGDTDEEWRGRVTV